MRLGLLLTTLASTLIAQAPTAEITGTINDSTGSPIPGALVTLTNPAINQSRNVRTNDSGLYVFPTLTPALYNLKVEASGFGTQVRNDLELQIGQIARLDFTMSVGTVSEVIEVKGGAPVLETETANLGAVVENRRIIELPLNGRNYLQLVALIPGATTNARPPTVAQLRMGGARSDFTVSVSGQRLAFNRYTLDGIENTDVNFASYLLLPSIDALQEFKVESGLFQAEFGRLVPARSMYPRAAAPTSSMAFCLNFSVTPNLTLRTSLILQPGPSRLSSATNSASPPAGLSSYRNSSTAKTSSSSW